MDTKTMRLGRFKSGFLRQRYQFKQFSLVPIKETRTSSDIKEQE